MRIAIRTLGELLITLGVTLLLFLVWQLWWTDVEANAESKEILESTRAVFNSQEVPDLDISDDDEAATGSGQSSTPGNGESRTPGRDTDIALAIVHMPTIGETRAVMNGVELSVLNQGVLGEYLESEAPGEIGNFAMAGHRTTYGRPLWSVADLTPGDPIVVETAEAYYVYLFQRTQIVTPFQTEVLADVPGDPAGVATERSMVMTACHPKFSAAQRIAAFSAMDYEQPRSEGPPPEMGG